MARRDVNAPSGPLDLSRTPQLAAARRFSQALVDRATAALASCADELSDIDIVVAAGSLGRLEAVPGSDFDGIVVVRDGCSDTAAARQVARVIDILAELGLKPPKADGIYRQAVERRSLLEPGALGSLSESAAVFGKRMQFLLDARPLFNGDACAELQRDILAWYGHGFHSADPVASWTYLINDVVRYLHAYAGWQQYKFARSHDDSWQLRQAKLRSTRMLTFAALLVLLGESNARSDKQAWLAQRLRLSPLERLATVMRAYDYSAFEQLLVVYETVFASLADPRVRERLTAGGPEHPDDLVAHANDAYAAMHASSATLMQMLTDFILDRRRDWDPRFFQRLLL